MPTVKTVPSRIPGKPDRYQGLVRLADEDTKSKTHDTYEEAWNWGVKIEAELRTERKRLQDAVVPQPPGGDLLNETLRATLALYATAKTCSSGSRRAIWTLDKVVGDTTVGQANDHWAENFLEHMRERTPKNRTKPYAEATLRKFLTAINLAIDWRARRLNIERPIYRIDMKLIAKGHDVIRTRRLSGEEWGRLRSRLRALRSKSGRQWRCLVWIALATGARLSEISDVPWSEIDLGKRRWLLPACRTKAGRARTIPLNKRATRLLRLLARHANPNDPRVFHLLGEAGSLSCRFWVLTRQAGVEDFRFHDFRHEAIVRFVIRAKCLGAYTKIMKIVGHADYTTFDRYITFADDEFQNVLD